MKVFKYLTMLGLAALGVMGCKKENLDEALSYRISCQETSEYTVSVPEYAVAGETVEVSISVNDKAVSVTSVLYNGSACEKVSFSGENNVYVYSFVMPERDVTLTVNTSTSRYGILCVENDNYLYIGPDDAVAEEKVEFELYVNPVYALTKVTYSYGDAETGTCDLEGEPVADNNGVSYKYSFTMPAGNVTLIPEYERPIYRIYSQLYESGVNVRPYNHYRVDYDDPDANEYGNVPDPDDPFWPGARIVESPAGDLIYFNADFDLGYDSPANHDNNPAGFITVKGLDSDLKPSGNDYSSGVKWTYDEGLDYWFWSFTMPAEPVLLEAVATELGTYTDRDFVGEYDGYYIHWGSEYRNTVQAVQSADVALALNANTVFTLKASETDRTPGYDYDNRGVYVYGEDNYIDYDLEACRDAQGRDNDGIGIQGSYNQDAWVMIALDPAQGGLSDTYRYFFTVKKDAGVTGFAAASNENGNRFLIELAKASGKEYWYYDAPVGQRVLSKVSADFEGKSINEDGATSAVMDSDGNLLFRYTYADDAPVFRLVGNEAGTYTGSAGDLVLDGTGAGTFNGEEGTYVLDESGMNLTFTTEDGTETVFIIYQSEKKYSIQSESGDSIEGTYSSANSEKAVCGYTPDWFSDGEARLTIKSAEDGTLKADFYLAGNGLVFHDEHDVNCVYDASSKKVSISGFLVANVGSWSGASSSRPIEFIVSDDETTLTCVNEKIQHTTKGPSVYVLSNFWQGESSWQVVLTKE